MNTTHKGNLSLTTDSTLTFGTGTADAIFYYNSYPSSTDILVADAFSKSELAPVVESVPPYPVSDVYETGDNLVLEVACTGIPKEDIKIRTQENLISISYSSEKTKEELDRKYYHNKISKRSFNTVYKFDSRYDIHNSEAKMENGLLILTIPFKEESAPKSLKIK